MVGHKALDARLNEHLGHEHHEPVANPAGTPATAVGARPELRTMLEAAP